MNAEIPQDFNHETETNNEDELVEVLEENFLDLKVPLKIKKIELLKSLGLPVSESNYFDTDDMEGLKQAVTSRLDGENALMVRFACDPDQFSMPTVSIEKNDDLEDKINQLQQLIIKENHIKKLILTSLTTREQAKNKISGRLMLEADSALPAQSILELYKGSRTTDVLNNPDTSDPNFLFLVKELGGQLKLRNERHSDCPISDSEIGMVFNTLKEYEDRLSMAKEVVAKSKGKTSEKLVVIFEFSYSNGKFVFSDFDY